MFRFHKYKGFVELPIIIAIVAAVVGVASIFILKKNDGPIEQVAEAVIEAQTGIEVDLSPEEKIMRDVVE